MAYLLFILICLVWGSSFILMKFATEAFGPITVGAGRVIGGTLALLVLMLIRKPSPGGGITRRHWPLLAVPVLVGMCYPYVMQPYLINKHQASALFGMMISLVPILTIVASIPLLRVRPTARQLIGVSVGLGGVALLNGAGLKVGVPLMSLMLGATVPLVYAFSNTYVKRALSDVRPLNLTTATLGCSAIILTPIGLALEPIESTSAAVPLWQSIGALAVLGVVGTGLATLMFFHLIIQRGPLFAGMVAYVVPAVAVLWGWVDAEPIRPQKLLALGAILAGVALVQWPAKRKD